MNLITRNMNNNKNAFEIPFKIGFVLLLALSFATPSFAHRSPDECSGSGLQISLFTNTSQVRIGDVISYGASVFNGPSVAGRILCDASDIQASIVTPDGQDHSISLLRTSLGDGEIDSYPNILTYIARAQDVKTDGTLTTTARVVGVIHQNDTDSQGGANQGVNTTVITAPPTTTPTTTPTLTPSPTPTPEITPPPPGGSSGSRTKKKPNVSLTQIVQPAPLLGASVSLSEIPATGVNEYSTFFIFMLSVVFWSIIILCVVFVKKLLRNRNKKESI